MLSLRFFLPVTEEVIVSSPLFPPHGFPNGKLRKQRQGLKWRVRARLRTTAEIGLRNLTEQTQENRWKGEKRCALIPLLRLCSLTTIISIQSPLDTRFSKLPPHSSTFLLCSTPRLSSPHFPTLSVSRGMWRGLLACSLFACAVED